MKKNNTNLLFGIHTLSSLLEHEPARILEIWVQDHRADKRLNQLISLAKQQGLAIHPSPKRTLDKLSEFAVHQGIVARCRPARPYDEQFLETVLTRYKERTLFLILDGVQDPHNLGACLRSADAAGVHAVIIPKNRSAQLSPTVEKTACGAATRVPLITVTNLARCLQDLQALGVCVIGLAGEATEAFFECDLNVPLALVLGAEEKGLRRLSREYCDYLAYLPMNGEVSSLNVSVTAGVCLYETVRQRAYICHNQAR